MERQIDVSMIGNYGKVLEKTNGKCQAAMGYLTTWAFPSEAYGYVSITITENDCEMSAFYKRNREAKEGMLMVAVWRRQSQEYTFHT